MITKERLEDLIREETIIYYIWYTKYAPYMRISECKLNNKMYVDDDILYLEDYDDGEILYLNDIFETKEEAEWYKEFGCIERTERLELPTWEEFEEKKFVWFVDKSQNQCCLYYLNVANKIFINISGEVIEIGDFTKENYTLACRKCKELFLKGNVND